MFRSRLNIDPTRLQDALLGIGAAAYFLGFFAGIEIVLLKLAY
jgi:hypothetical protein